MIRGIKRCPCGHPSCRDWHVAPEAALQGVGYTETQAAAVAGLLNLLEKHGGDLDAMTLDLARAVQTTRLGLPVNSVADTARLQVLLLDLLDVRRADPERQL